MCHWDKRTNPMRQSFCVAMPLWEGFVREEWTDLPFSQIIEVAAILRESTNPSPLKFSTAIRAHETPFVRTRVQLFHPLSSLCWKSASSAALRILSPALGAIMQPYVAHRPPPCGVTLVIIRHTHTSWDKAQLKIFHTDMHNYFWWSRE